MPRFVIPKRHDDINGETIAQAWHTLATAISIAAMISGIGIAVTAGAGAYWHRWAAKQHRDDIDRLNKEKPSEPSNQNR